MTFAISIDGVVQGVGFRPFIKNLADEMGVRGFVRNDGGRVYIEAVTDDCESFVSAIKSRAPKGSAIVAVEVKRLKWPCGMTDFSIEKSVNETGGLKMPSPDLAVCEDCLKELYEEGNPRHRNPFISCTHCGPRYSIMRCLPYDRENTAMAAFPMCRLCGSEYTEPSDRRYHAQTVCCNRCGPKLSGIMNGDIAAIKGIGGYHLACLAYDEEAVKRLREVKAREHKPFAVMFESLEALKKHAKVTKAEEALLTSAAAPIVLVKRKKSAIAKNVYGSSPYLGAFLPYTPLQHMILRETGPLVMTSANQSSEPIIISDEAMREFSGVDSIISHDRDILRRLDDSVVQVVNGKTQFLRRARGYVPLAIPMPKGEFSLIALGGQEKNTFCLFDKGYAYPSQENGDLGSLAAEEAFRSSVKDMTALFELKPDFALSDWHPVYATTEIAKEWLLAVKIQHHHAHIASVMAEHGLDGPVLGVAFDGTGYAEDGTIWGGEFLLATAGGYERKGHLKAVPFLGGDEAVRDSMKSAWCLMNDAGIPFENDLVKIALKKRINTHLSSSVGRLFDAVSAMLGICTYAEYGGQPAMALENAAAKAKKKAKEPFAVDIALVDGQFIGDFAPCLREIYACDAPVNERAYRFHVTVAQWIVTMCEKIGVKEVALSGGCFQNRLLVELVEPELEKRGFRVYRNHLVPPGDEGISLGQMLIGQTLLKGGK